MPKYTRTVTIFCQDPTSANAKRQVLEQLAKKDKELFLLPGKLSETVPNCRASKNYLRFREEFVKNSLDSLIEQRQKEHTPIKPLVIKVKITVDDITKKVEISFRDQGKGFKKLGTVTKPQQYQAALVKSGKGSDKVGKKGLHGGRSLGLGMLDSNLTAGGAQGKLSIHNNRGAVIIMESNLDPFEFQEKQVMTTGNPAFKVPTLGELRKLKTQDHDSDSEAGDDAEDVEAMDAGITMLSTEETDDYDVSKQKLQDTLLELALLPPTVSEVVFDYFYDLSMKVEAIDSTELEDASEYMGVNMVEWRKKLEFDDKPLASQSEADSEDQDEASTEQTSKIVRWHQAPQKVSKLTDTASSATFKTQMKQQTSTTEGVTDTTPKNSSSKSSSTP